MFGHAGKARFVFEDGIELCLIQRNTVVVRQTGNQVIGLDGSGTNVANGCDRVFLDRFVSRLATGPGLNCFHHDGGGTEEGKILLVLEADDFRIRLHVAEDGEESLQLAIEAVYRIG